MSKLPICRIVLAPGSVAPFVLFLAACSGHMTAASGVATTASAVATTSATLNAAPACNGGHPTLCSYFFRWSIYPSFPATAATHQSSPQTTWSQAAGSGRLSASVSNLIPGTTYYFQLCGARGDVSQFRCVGPGGATNSHGAFTTPTAHNMPPVTWSGIHLAQTFNFREPPVCCRAPPTGFKTREQGYIDYVFAADGLAGNVPANGAWHEIYFPWARDPRGRAPWYFQAKHPTWVEYRCDASGNPLRDSSGHPMLAYWQGSDVRNAELDTTNPAVQRYYEQFAETELATGFRGISFDNGVSWNEAAVPPKWNAGGACGHFDANQRWVHQYSGALRDSMYARTQSQAFAAVMAAIRQRYPSATATVNQRFVCDNDWADPLPTTSMIFDEGAFTKTVDGTWLDMRRSNGCGAGAWRTTIQEYVVMQRDQGKGLVLTNDDDGITITNFVTDTDMTARAHLQWVLANYLLVRYAHTYLAWQNTSNYGRLLPNEREYGLAARIGTATGDYYFAQGVAMRAFTHGLAIVNPDPSHAHTVSVGSGYCDLYGKSASAITMTPDSGAVLLKR